MSERLTFSLGPQGLVTKFDGKPVPADKMEQLTALLWQDMDRRVRQLSAAAAEAQDGPLRVGAVQIGACGDDDPKTLPRLSLHSRHKQ